MQRRAVTAEYEYEGVLFVRTSKNKVFWLQRYMFQNTILRPATAPADMLAELNAPTTWAPPRLPWKSLA